jgi:A/G-specific adenine glycosylase
MEKHEGKFPSKYEEILALSGIGEYTAGAIYSIVFDGIQPAVDGNVLRIVSRLAVIDAPIRSTKTVQRIRKLARYFMSRERPGDFNQALMEMGGRICLPKNPRCDQCVLQVSCRAKQQNCQSELPCKSAKKAPQLKNVNLLVAKTASGQILMSCTQRPGLYSGMWQLPKVTVVTKSTMVEELLREKVEGAWTDFTKIMEYEHQFSHQIWKITVFQVKLMEWENKHYHLIDDVKTLPIAGAMKKALGLEKQG